MADEGSSVVPSRVNNRTAPLDSSWRSICSRNPLLKTAFSPPNAGTANFANAKPVSAKPDNLPKQFRRRRIAGRADLFPIGPPQRRRSRREQHDGRGDQELGRAPSSGEFSPGE